MIIEHGNIIDSPDLLQENKIVGELKDNDTTITFNGKGNILYLDGDVKINNSEISFLSNNGVIYLTGSEKMDYQVKLDCWRYGTIYVGGDNYFNPSRRLCATASERKHIIIGGGGVFSFDIWIRTADPHIIYDCDSHQRINPSKNVLIGDHVWLGQSAIILKGTSIGSGSIIGAASVLSGKRVPSNTVYAGNPARQVKDNVFFTGKSVHNYTIKKTKESMSHDGDEYIFDDPGAAINENQLFEKLDECKTSDERLHVIKTMVAENTDKNRFAIEDGSNGDGSSGHGSSARNSVAGGGIRGLFRKG